MDRDKISILYKGPSIDASYQVSGNLAEGFQRRRLKCEKLTDDRRRTPSDDKSSHCLWQGERKRGKGGAIIFHLILMKLGKKYDRNGGRFVFESLKLLLLYCECGLKFLPNKYICV